jgi:hypothetical protein
LQRERTPRERSETANGVALVVSEFVVGRVHQSPLQSSREEFDRDPAQRQAKNDEALEGLLLPVEFADVSPGKCS